MTVQTAGGMISIGAGDLVRTDRGVTWCIKCRDLADVKFILIFIRDSTGAWGVDTLPEAQIETDFANNVVKYTNLNDWFAKVCLPKLNAWLAKKFPPTPVPPSGVPAPVPAPVPTDAFGQADALIQTIRFTTSPIDGTIVASV